MFIYDPSCLVVCVTGNPTTYYSINTNTYHYSRQKIRHLPIKTQSYSIFRVPTTQLAKMSIALKFVELTADSLKICYKISSLPPLATLVCWMHLSVLGWSWLIMTYVFVCHFWGLSSRPLFHCFPACCMSLFPNLFCPSILVFIYFSYCCCPFPFLFSFS